MKLLANLIFICTLTSAATSLLGELTSVHTAFLIDSELSVMKVHVDTVNSVMLVLSTSVHVILISCDWSCAEFKGQLIERCQVP